VIDLTGLAVMFAGFIIGDRVFARYFTGSWTGKITDVRNTNTKSGDIE